MHLVRTLLRIYLQIPYHYRKISRTGAFGAKGGRYTDMGIPSNGNPLKRAMMAHHVKQFHESSCSVATVVSVVNAIKSVRDGTFEPIDQKGILERVETGHWKERMSDGGYNGRRGLPLTLLGDVVKSSLDIYHVGYQTVETIQAEKKPGLSAGIKDYLRKSLSLYETKGSCVVIAHFDQGVFVPALNIPHISPVGGFDIEKGRVTILDVDPDQEKPYHVSFDTFYRGLASDYHHIFKAYGYGSGGAVVITLK